MKYFEKNLELINKGVNSIKKEVFENLLNDCFNTLENGGKIIASGLGKNVAVCDKFVGEMVSLGQQAQFLHTNSAVHGDLGIIQDGDLVIVLTKSGETIESIHLVEHLLKRNIKIWLLTFEKESTLTKKLENALVINLEHEGDDWNIVPHNSSILNLIVLQELAVNIARKRNVKLTDFKFNHPGGHIGDILKNN